MQYLKKLKYGAQLFDETALEFINILYPKAILSFIFGWCCLLEKGI